MSQARPVRISVLAQEMSVEIPQGITPAVVSRLHFFGLRKLTSVRSSSKNTLSHVDPEPSVVYPGGFSGCPETPTPDHDFF